MLGPLLLLRAADPREVPSQPSPGYEPARMIEFGRPGRMIRPLSRREIYRGGEFDGLVGLSCDIS